MSWFQLKPWEALTHVIKRGASGDPTLTTVYSAFASDVLKSDNLRLCCTGAGVEGGAISLFLEDSPEPEELAYDEGKAEAKAEAGVEGDDKEELLAACSCSTSCFLRRRGMVMEEDMVYGRRKVTNSRAVNRRILTNGRSCLCWIGGSVTVSLKVFEAQCQGSRWDTGPKM